MSEYLAQFKSCGKNVRVEENVYIEHPEAMEVGDNVAFMRGFYMVGRPRVCRIGSHVRFWPNCFIQGSPGRFLVGDHVDFFPNTYISLGSTEENFVEIGQHTHFAPGCVLYGWGGLTIGAHCSFAAHVVFATVAHDPDAKDTLMTNAAKAGPIVVEDEVWIGANATVILNTRIASGCAIGANAVVTHSTEPNGVYVGVPARRLRHR